MEAIFNHSYAPKTKSNFNLWEGKTKYLELCEKHKDEFFDIVKKHKFQTAGIFYAEAFAFLCFCKYFNIDVLIESGMSKGNSTELFLKYFKGDVYTFEATKKDHHKEVEDRLSSYNNLKKIIYKDSNSGIEEVIEEIKKDKKVAVFIDGPKDNDAVRLLNKCFKYENVIFGGIHDICNPITKTRQNYDFMRLFGKQHILSTDEKEFRTKYEYMDEVIEDPAGAWIYNEKGISELSLDKDAIKIRFPNGPGIGIAVNIL